VIELVDSVTGLAAEKVGQADVAARQHMHRQVLGSGRHSAGVIVPGQPDQKPWRAHAGLRGEADQAARRMTVGLGSHHEHRVLQHPDQPVERVIAHTAIMAQRQACGML
jgi:hypothetical protein